MVARDVHDLFLLFSHLIDVLSNELVVRVRAFFRIRHLFYVSLDSTS